MMQKLYAVLVCLLLHTALCAQTIYRVSTTGNDNHNGLTWSAPFRTLQKALSTASGNAQIWVARGTYFPDEGPSVMANDRIAAFVMKNGVAIYGGFAGTETVLSGRNWKTNPTILSGDIDQNDGPAFANNGGNSYQVLRNFNNGLNNTAILDGFTITGGNAISTATENRFGGGMFNAGSSPLVVHCSFRGNSGEFGGAVANVQSAASFVSCTFSGNKAATYGGAAHNENNATPKFTSCAFWANTAVTAGGAIFNLTAASTVTNCSFSGNAAPNSGGHFDFNSNSTIIASIFWGNGIEIGTQGGATTVSKSIVKGGYAGTGNLTQDPLFFDSASGNLRLLPCSPAIDAGSDAITATTDADGNPRKFDAYPGGTLVDIGAYEFQALIYSSRLHVNALAPAGGDGQSWNTALRTLQDALRVSADCQIISEIWVAKGTYYPDEGPGLKNNDRTVSFDLQNGVAIYGGFAGNETALNQRNWRVNRSILSGDIDQNDGSNFQNYTGNSQHVVVATGVGNTAVIDGFTITSGHATSVGSRQQRNADTTTLMKTNFNGNLGWGHGGGGTYTPPAAYVVEGAGMFNDGGSPVITNCTFTLNKALIGGGMFNRQSAPIISGCAFLNNKTDRYGSAIEHKLTNLKLTDCIFAGNSTGTGTINTTGSYTLINCVFANNNMNSGSAVYGSASGNLVVNCTFYGNSAANGGAVIQNDGAYPSNTQTIQNSIFWANQGGAVIQGGQATITYSNVQGGVLPGTGNSSQDPLFVNAANPAGADGIWGTSDDGLRLACCSPSGNTGSNALVPAGTTTDIKGSARIQNSIVDMGAYELASNGGGNKFFVTATGSGVKDGSSWANAFGDIQKAIDASCALDSVFVKGGIYIRQSSINMKEGVKIYGHFAGTETSLAQRNLGSANTSIIEGSQDFASPGYFGSPLISNPASSGLSRVTVLDGFTLRNNYSDFGGGMFNESASPTVRNCVFEDLYGSFGNAVFQEGEKAGEHPLFEKCIFRKTKDEDIPGSAQMAMRIRGASPVFDRCVFDGAFNAYETVAIVFSSESRARVFNSVFINYETPITCADADITIVNSTFARNEIPVLLTDPRPFQMVPKATLNNCVLWGNSYVGNPGNFKLQPFINYSILPDTSTVNYGLGNIKANPLYVDIADPDGPDNVWGTADDGLRLQCGSPAINAGRNDSLPTGITVDLAGAARIQQGTVDMGAYERFGATNKKLYVTQTGAGTKDGSSWTNATPDLQWAIDQSACSANSVFVMKGRYQPAAGQSFVLREGVKVYGHFAGTENTLKDRRLNSTDTTVLRGNGASVINNNSNGLTAATLLDGFVITGGSGTQGGGMRNVSASPTVQNCFFTANTATEGGAIYANISNPVISNCIFANNSSATGAAIRGVFSNFTITNSTLAGNSGSNAIVTANGSLTLQNSIVWGNAGAITAGGLGSRTYLYNNVQGGVLTGTGNVSQEPLFVNAANSAGADGILGTPDDGLRLGCGSPAKNVGSNALVPAGLETDILGFSRIRNTTVDMGAYEATGGGSTKLFVSVSGSGLKDGSSWANAFGDIQTAINEACGNDSVFVKGGIYGLTSSIHMKEAVKIYGHFAGTETSLAHRVLSSANSSTIEGSLDFQSPGYFGAPLISNTIASGLSRAAILDGFTLRNNYSDFGGAMYNDKVSPTVRNCVFEDLYGVFANAIYQNGEQAGDSPLFEKCTFQRTREESIPSTSSRAVFILGTSPIFNQCVFDGLFNFDEVEGILFGSGSRAVVINSIFVNYSAPIRCADANVTIVNCTFAKNDMVAAVSDPRPFQLYPKATFNNCVLWGNTRISDPNNNLPTLNYCITSDTSSTTVYLGVGNIKADPLYVNMADPDGPDNIWGTADDGLRLQCGSPAINAGRNDSLPAGTTLDVAGAPRIQQGQVDMGAYENLPQLTTYTFTGSGNWSVVSNWQGGMKPPSPLPPCSEVVINPTTGNCVLDTPFVVPPPGKITVKQGKNFIIPGNLLQQ